jgi:4-amino-4-deoxy-L-arabinose transferase-like glycosyltransferase
VAINKFILGAELAFAQVLLLFAIFVGPYSMIVWPAAGPFGALVLLGAGIILAALLVGFIGTRIEHGLAAVVHKRRFAQVILLGILAQILVALFTHPVFTSDARTYLLLANKLANGMAYMDEAGNLAFFPPGLPLFLAPFVVVFGPSLMAVTLANITLYIVSAFAIHDLGKRLFEEKVGLAAIILFTIWPSRLLTAGLASKENLTIAMVLTGSALCVVAFASTNRKSWLSAVGAGAAFGLAGLAQPGLMLLVAAVPIAFRYRWQSIKKFQYIGKCAVVFACMVACLLPWQMRNCVVFKNQFCGIATNGGSVFYRANNPKATGEFTERGEISISNLTELEQNRIGFALGKQWIKENPKEFLTLSAKKLVYLLGDDAQGAYWGILRGEGGNHDQSLKSGAAARIIAYKIADWISWVFWVLVATLGARTIAQSRRLLNIKCREKLLPLIYPLLYSTAVFSVFESGSRQHAIALALVLVLASASIALKFRRTDSVE